MKTMKERPIIFSAESVKQILSGTKTQTRRVVKPQLYGWEPYKQPEWYTSSAIDKDGMLVPGKEVFGVYSEDGECSRVCPYGAPGDRLWAREAFFHYESGADSDTSESVLFYKDTIPPEWENVKWRSPLFLPRRHSRLTLEITNVRCEQLQDISDADAVAEGFATPPYHQRKARFAIAWDSLNAKRGFDWCMNPYVWVLEFKKVESERNE